MSGFTYAFDRDPELEYTGTSEQQKELMAKAASAASNSYVPDRNPEPAPVSAAS